jgi:threonine synthase
MTNVTHLECSLTGERYEAGQVHNLSRAGKPLLVRYDLDAARRTLTRESLETREPGMWKWRELLPHDGDPVSLGEPETPIVPLPNTGGAHLLVKDEGRLPTGSFKARGLAMAVTMARQFGIERIALPTNGNAGAAWSIYCAKAGIDAYIVMPVDAPLITRSECAIAGAKLYLVNGLISDAGKIVARAVNKYKWTDASTLKEPYRIEGKKTMGLEIAEQFGWEVPDVILYPTGGGVGIIGIYKALLELREIGWIGDKMPRLVAVQSEGCAPIVKAWEEKQAASEFWSDSSTIAFGINVPKALGDFLVLDAVKQTGGCAIAVSDEEVLHDQAELARTEGLFICPEGAATLSAYKQLLNSGWIKSGEKTVLLNTGSGLKYPNTVSVNVPVLEQTEDIPG